MSCKELVLIVLAASGCRDRCEQTAAPPPPAQKPVEAVTEPSSPSLEPFEPPVAEPSPPPPARVAPPPAAEPQPRPQVAEAPQPPAQSPAPPSAPPPPPERRPFEEYYPHREQQMPPQLPPAPVQVFPQALPQYNDAGVLVPAVPLWIDPSAEPGTPGNGAPDPKHPNP